MTEVSEMLKRMRELSAESTVEVRVEDPGYSGLNYSRDPGYGAIPSLTSLDLSDIFKTDNSNVQPFTWNSLTPSSVGTITAGTGLNYSSPYTFSNNTNPASATWTSVPFSNGSTGTSSQIDLKGPEADIRINGVSLADTLKVIQDRLNVLVPNPELEAEWDQLRELGEQYRALENKLKEQGDMWTKLKSMPPPEID
jgi:hypothetical protein